MTGHELYAKLFSMNVCSESLNYVRDRRARLTAEQIWNGCTRAEWIFYLLRRCFQNKAITQEQAKEFLRQYTLRYYPSKLDFIEMMLTTPRLRPLPLDDYFRGNRAVYGATLLRQNERNFFVSVFSADHPLFASNYLKTLHPWERIERALTK